MKENKNQTPRTTALIVGFILALATAAGIAGFLVAKDADKRSDTEFEFSQPEKMKP